MPPLPALARSVCRSAALRRPGLSLTPRATTAISRSPRAAITNASSASSPNAWTAAIAPGWAAVLREAERLVAAGVIGASGDQPGHVGLRHPTGKARRGQGSNSSIFPKSYPPLGAWVRLHYVPTLYRHVARPDPADGPTRPTGSCPYPRHPRSSMPIPTRLKRHGRGPAAASRTWTRSRAWRRDCPRTFHAAAPPFIVGYPPAETEAEFQTLLDGFRRGAARTGSDASSYEKRRRRAVRTRLPDHVPRR